jgi:hypothetical protein
MPTAENERASYSWGKKLYSVEPSDPAPNYILWRISTASATCNYGSDLEWSTDTYQAAYKKLPQRICEYNERFLFHVPVDQHVGEYEDEDGLAMIDSDMPEAL